MEVLTIEEFKDSENIKDIFIAIGASFLILLISLTIIPFFIMLIPCPLIVLTVKRGYLSGLAGIIGTSILSLIGFDIQLAFIVFTYLMLISLIMAYMINNNYKPSQIIIISAIGILIFVVLNTVFIGSLNDMDIVTNMENTLTNVIDSELDTLAKSGISTENIDELFGSLKKGLDLFIILTPSILTVFSFIFMALNYICSTAALKKLGIKSIKVPKLYEFEVPRTAIIGIAVTAVAVFILKLLGFKFYNELMLNAYFLFTTLFLVNGIAFVDFHLRKRVNLIIRIIMPILLIGILNLTLFYVFLGVLDMIFRFRHRAKQV